MVHKYKKKTNRYCWSDDNMQLALNSCESGKSCKGAALEFGVPRSTLQRKFRNGKERNENLSAPSPSTRSMGGFQYVFNQNEEQALYNYIIDMEERLLRLSSVEVRRLGFQFAEKLGKSHSFNRTTGLAGKCWFRSIMQRNNLSLRKSEATSVARANGFNKEAVQEFYTLVDTILKKYQFNADDIYNVDETGISIVPKQQSAVVARKGRRQVGGLTAAERGELVTAEICMSATGKYMPPMLIFPRVRENKEFSAGAPAGAWAEFHITGYSTCPIFTKWFRAFIKWSGASKAHPVLLFMDQHMSHIKNLEVLELAEENGVKIVCFPSHCTHKMQMLDVAFNKPLSTNYTQEVVAWQRQGRKVTLRDVFQLFGNAFIKSAKMETAVNAFRATGIVPFNPNIFKDSDFVNLMKDEPLTVSSPEVQKCNDIIKEIQVSSEPVASPVIKREIASTSIAKVNSQANINNTSTSLQLPVSTIMQAQALISALQNVISQNSNSPPVNKICQNHTLGVSASENNIDQTISSVINEAQAVSTTEHETPSSAPAPQKRKRPRLKAVEITDPVYKENLIQEKLKNIKKEPGLKKTRKSKPKVASNLQARTPLQTLQAGGITLLQNTNCNDIVPPSTYPLTEQRANQRYIIRLPQQPSNQYNSVPNNFQFNVPENLNLTQVPIIFK